MKTLAHNLCGGSCHQVL